MFSRVSLAGLTLFASLAQVLAQIPAGCDRTYTVALGDTCNSISAAQNVSTFQLAFVNPGINADCSNLFAGEILCLGITGQDCTNTTVIQSGDFCAEIADEAGIDLSTLLDNNPNVNPDCTNIVVGEVLCTASTIIPY
ncbi:hypothetical protein NM688_g3689 [Phlebia brevispora]|uniref:Uncharacterized protein n=1 Tax=Phlebia brevispora TaxID=194682 RepID=A0ACC1T511_9APHY|nr:hypothetical protein NM688_g3689 [Phlebia brevispora]